MAADILIKGGSVLAFITVGTAQAQFRDNMPPVLQTRPAPMQQERVDVAELFHQVYLTAGRPRIVVMWNRELAEATETSLEKKEVETIQGSSSSESMAKSTHGPTDSVTMSEQVAKKDQTRTMTATTGRTAQPERSTTLAERHALVLQRAFSNGLRRGGARLIDRTMITRTTAAASHPAGADPALIEADALRHHAEILLEVLMIEDKDAPAGYGFDIRAKDIQSGEELTSLYSKAIPDRAPQRPGAWVAGKTDFEFKQAPAPKPPGPDDIGMAVARDVMVTLGMSLEKRSAKP